MTKIQFIILTGTKGCIDEKMKKGRRKDHVWRFVKYLGDIAYYARCSCGFRYACYKEHSKEQQFPLEIAPEKLYNYCPICGSRKTRYIEEITKIDKYPWE